MFPHCVKVPQLLLWQKKPPRVLIFFIICGLVHFLGVGGLDFFRVVWYRAKVVVYSGSDVCPSFG